MGGWCLEERHIYCTTEVTQQVLNCDMEPGEVLLRLSGGPFRALLGRPQPVEEPKACGVPESCLQPRGRWIKPLQELDIFFFIKNH